MEFLIGYLRQRKKALLAFALSCAVFAAAFFLYELPLAAVLYPAVLCLVLFVIALGLDVKKALQKHRQLLALSGLPAELMERFPACEGLNDEDYQRIIAALCRQVSQLKADTRQKYRDMTEYYTTWAHQIKTPLASMRLTLQSQDGPAALQLSQDLFRVSQYVDMVMAFLRLDSDSTDYLFAQWDLDGLVKDAVKKFSSQFIQKKIRLEFAPLHAQALTDGKWLGFVLEQVLSNALKYTPEGGCIRITLEPPLTLCVADTGIGIAPEDLPRVFEKGYTGENGRKDTTASGMGLYLCRRICASLGCSIQAESPQKKGTVIRIVLPSQPNLTQS